MKVPTLVIAGKVKPNLKYPQKSKQKTPTNALQDMFDSKGTKISALGIIIKNFYKWGVFSEKMPKQLICLKSTMKG